MMKEVGFMDDKAGDEEVSVPKGSLLISPSSEFAKFWDVRRGTGEPARGAYPWPCPPAPPQWDGI